MKFCYNCGAKIEEGAKFCVECGAELSLVDVKEEKSEHQQELDRQKQETERRAEIERQRREVEQKEIERQRREAEQKEVERQRREAEHRQEFERQRREEERRRITAQEKEKQEADRRKKEAEFARKKTRKRIAAVLLSIVAIAAVFVSILFIKKYYDKDDSRDDDSKAMGGKNYYGSVTIDYKYKNKDCVQFELNDIDDVEYQSNGVTEGRKKYHIIMNFKPGLFDWFSEDGNCKAAQKMYLVVDGVATSFECDMVGKDKLNDEIIKIKMGFGSDSYDEYKMIIDAIHEDDHYHPDEARFMFYDILWHEILNSNDITSINIAQKTATGCQIMINFNEAGQSKYLEATRNNLRRCLMFVVDNELVSAPYITSEVDSDHIFIEVQSEEEARKIADAFKSEDKYIPAQKHNDGVKEWCFNPGQNSADFKNDRSNLPDIKKSYIVRYPDLMGGHVDRAIEWEEDGIYDESIFEGMGPNTAIEVSYVSSSGCIWLVIDGKRVDWNDVETKEENENIHWPKYNNSRNIAMFTYDDIVRDVGESDSSKWKKDLKFGADGAWKVFAVRVVEIEN